ncbi:MAG: tRNA (adenosine(37)-N6)-threonylcarbamoyltransferase complex transferase subunit TsaD [Candidatus Niyogibacteria bacterium]|nr:tRNA (adenosine(37)-N6)-threonylcarbamoyltransferase complex transferase subunit TsaD [Candidatus Niyogibacteria bacterium]
MRILGIETSCDETALAVVEADGGLERPRFRIESSLVASQAELHAEFGGVVPNIAKREHAKNLPILFKQLQTINDKLQTDIIAVTVGPGLEPCLWEGITFAQSLARDLKKPIVAVNHMEGHIASVLLSQNGSEIKLKKENIKFQFPALVLLVSGGHTELVWMKRWLDYEILGETQDDAVGEAFDKVARLLGLPYPGGPEISRLAEKARTRPPKMSKAELLTFPRPMIKSRDLSFSFSGLKTAVLYALKNPPAGGPELDKADVARAFEDAAVEALVFKTIKAVKAKNPETVLVAGGVSANRHLRREMETAVVDISASIPVLYPDPAFTGDNAAMIAAAGYFHTFKKDFVKPEELRAKGRLRLTASAS